MYKCQVTGKLSRQGDPRIGGLMLLHESGAVDESKGSEKLNKIVVETRTKEYRNWDNESEEEWFSYGTEIVREINASDTGLSIWNSWTEDQRKSFLKSL